MRTHALEARRHPRPPMEEEDRNSGMYMALEAEDTNRENSNKALEAQNADCEKANEKLEARCEELVSQKQSLAGILEALSQILATTWLLKGKPQIMLIGFPTAF
ncbi:hypothetical protein K469DRAFT_684474 [Zopfia rhizophila CBS 207.26]|uniref:Uncharacterized protein n=1 Tax=Zopfia rhizophila CBS 207.26 TaxID=1314779 RepID=A0A6A6DA40_9PEZI|nr:hypothetical protein K469DRAFT_684474 [Zopfia rhizophila CBS 207.26]